MGKMNKIDGLYQCGFLIVIFCCSFARIYHWKKLSNGCMGSLLFLATAYASVIISRSFFIKGELSRNKVKSRSKLPKSILNIPREIKKKR